VNANNRLLWAPEKGFTRSAENRNPRTGYPHDTYGSLLRCFIVLRISVGWLPARRARRIIPIRPDQAGGRLSARAGRSTCTARILVQRLSANPGPHHHRGESRGRDRLGRRPRRSRVADPRRLYAECWAMRGYARRDAGDRAHTATMTRSKALRRLPSSPKATRCWWSIRMAPPRPSRDCSPMRAANPGQAQFRFRRLRKSDPSASGELLKLKDRNSTVVHVPYKGAPEAVAGMLSGPGAYVCSARSPGCCRWCATARCARSASRARPATRSAPRIAHPDRRRLAGFRRLDVHRRHGAGRHAAGDRRQAQCRHQ